MKKIIVKGKVQLKGEIEIDGAKNSTLPIIAASILGNSRSVLKNIPDISDLYKMMSIIDLMGGTCKYNKETKELVVDPSNINTSETNKDMVTKLRASFIFAGSLLSKFKKATIYYPGGCSIGTRPIDIHLKGFESLGVKIKNEYGYIKLDGSQMKGTEIFLDFPSVGATQNLILASVMAKGKTTIYNAAEEPEIFDMINFLMKMGAKIENLSSKKIVITGVKELKGVEYEIMPDRIEAGTYIIATALTKGDVFLKNAKEDDLKPLVIKLRENGVDIINKKNGLHISTKNLKNNPLDIKTLPHPGFPTDLQTQMLVYMTQCNGTSTCLETIFNSRFKITDELKKMGARIKIEGGKSCIIEGQVNLNGATVEATDLRAGASLILAGLIADGETVIEKPYHIYRGYSNIESKLRKLGANIISI